MFFVSVIGLGLVGPGQGPWAPARTTVLVTTTPADATFTAAPGPVWPGAVPQRSRQADTRPSPLRIPGPFRLRLLLLLTFTPAGPRAISSPAPRPRASAYHETLATLCLLCFMPPEFGL
jgi:hypothetical protein